MGEVLIVEHVTSQRAPKGRSGARRDPVQVAVGEEALRQNGKSDASDSFSLEDIEKAVFDPAIEHGVRGLMDEQRSAQSAQDSDRLRRALVRIGGNAHVERLPRRDCGMKSAERLLKGCLCIKVVVVEDVDVVEAQPAQTLIEACEEIFPRSKVAIGARPHVPAGLGGDDEFVAILAEVLAEDPSEIRLGTAIRGPIVVGQIKMGDTQVEGTPQDGALSLERSVITEVLPQPKRYRR